MSEYLTVDRVNGLLQIRLRDHWVFDNLSGLQQTLDEIEPGPDERVSFQCGGLKDFDLAGAWLLYDKSMDLEELGVRTQPREGIEHQRTRERSRVGDGGLGLVPGAQPLAPHG